jgi:hypothetical protein
MIWQQPVHIVEGEECDQWLQVHVHAAWVCHCFDLTDHPLCALIGSSGLLYFFYGACFHGATSMLVGEVAAFIWSVGASFMRRAEVFQVACQVLGQHASMFSFAGWHCLLALAATGYIVVSCVSSLSSSVIMQMSKVHAHFV